MPPVPALLARTVRENGARADFKVPLLTEIEMFEYVATLPAVGVPERPPVAVLKASHDGLFVMLKVAALPVVFFTVGVNEYAEPTVALVGAEPLSASSGATEPEPEPDASLMEKRGKLAQSLASETSIRMLGQVYPVARFVGALPVIVHV